MSSVLLSNFCFTSSQTALARLTGISPLHGSHPAVLIACDGSHRFSVLQRSDCDYTGVSLCRQESHGNHLANNDLWTAGINRSLSFLTGHGVPVHQLASYRNVFRSEERRVGKECRSRWSPYH